MSSTTLTFQSSSSLQLTTPKHRNHDNSCRTTPPKATATFPSKQRSRSEVPLTITTHTKAYPPSTPLKQDAQDLEEYEKFIQSCTDEEKSTIATSPVFKPLNGGLVCEWNSDIARGKTITDYEKFLTSPDAIGVDSTKPVYLTNAGLLVCHYP